MMQIHFSQTTQTLSAHALAAQQWLKSHGLPQRKLEHWRMTPIHKLLRREFFLKIDRDLDGVCEAIAAYRADFAPKPGHLLVLCNGSVSAELSDLDVAGLILSAGHDLPQIPDYARLPFMAQNLGFGLEETPILDIAARCVLAEPLHVLCLHGGREAEASFSRLVVRLGTGAKAVLVESHVSLAPAEDSGAYANSLVEAILGEGATLAHYKWQNLAENHAHIAASIADVGANAHLDAFVLNLGGGLVRQDTEVMIMGSGAQAIINGAYVGRGKQHIDNTSQIQHRAPDSYSREVYKGVLSDISKGVFQARILVDQCAQRTDAYQMNRALLLSEQAEVQSKPELEIYADDVKCSHGATVGQLNTDQLFYMTARGIRPEDAQVLLIEAYLEDAFSDMIERDLAERFAVGARRKLCAMAQAKS